MKCTNCGAELSQDTKFCSYCGHKIETTTPHPIVEETEIPPIPHSEHVKESEKRNSQKSNAPKSLADKAKEKSSEMWKKLSLYGKITTVSIAVFVLLFLVALLAGKVTTVIIAVVQIALGVVSILMHKGVIKLEQKRLWLKWLVLAVAILFSILNILSYSWGQESDVPHLPPIQETTSVTDEPVITTVTAPYSVEECIGQDFNSIKNGLSSAGFTSIKVEKIEDLKNADEEKLNTIESVTIGGMTDFSKGQEFNKSDEVVILYHVYAKCDVKIHVDFIPNLIFSKYDVNLLLNGIEKGTLPHGEDKDFEFNIELGDYTLTFESDESSSVKGEVALTVDCDIEASYKISCSSDAISVETLDVYRFTELADGEVRIDFSESEFKGKDYTEVENNFKNLGFTNINFEPIYDVTSDDTTLEKTETVTIDGSSDYVRGDVFTNDVAVVISYHANEGEDPAKLAQAAIEATLEETLPKEMARRAVVVAMTNCQATDVFTTDGYSYDTSKFHSYSDVSGFFMTPETDGTWNAKDESTWHVDGMMLRIFGYDTYLKVSCDVRKEEDNYIVSGVDSVVANKEYIDSDDPSKIYVEHYEPSDSNPFLTVPSSMISEDRDNSAANAKMNAKEKRQEWIENQFSLWDGRHVALSDLIKDNLNDSKSFKHIDVSYIDVCDEKAQATVNDALKSDGYSQRVEVGDLLVIEEFSAKNGFNATIKSIAYGIVRGSDDSVILLGIE